jgi:hypothetical protein
MTSRIFDAKSSRACSSKLGRRAVAQVPDLALVDLHVELLRLRIPEIDRDGRVPIVEVRLRDLLRDEPRASVPLVHLVKDRLRDRGIGRGDAHPNEAGEELVGDLGLGHADAEALRLVGQKLALDQAVEGEALEVEVTRDARAPGGHEHAVGRAEVLRVDATTVHLCRAGLVERGCAGGRVRAERDDEGEDHHDDDRAVDGVRQATLPEEIEHGRGSPCITRHSVRRPSGAVWVLLASPPAERGRG